MKKVVLGFVALFLGLALGLISSQILAGYGSRFCGQEGFTCIKIVKGQSWESLWPDPYDRDLVKRLNRVNIPLYPGMTIAVPHNLDSLEINDLAPFTQQIRPMESKTIIVSPAVLAWGAYSPAGDLIRWGPISAGKNYCPDVSRACRTKTGIHHVYDKRGAGCISTKFPVGRGGAPMPYCMFYYGGYALHGSPQVPGYHASHGCIRLFTEDARWLNQEFTSGEKTKVIVLPYGSQ